MKCNIFVFVYYFFTFLKAAQTEDDFMKLLWCYEVLSSSEESENEGISDDAPVSRNKEVSKCENYMLNSNALKRQKNFLRRRKTDYEKVREEPRPYLYCICRVANRNGKCNKLICAQDIKKHLLSHSDEKPYTCSSCTKKHAFLSEALDCSKKDKVLKRGLLR